MATRSRVAAPAVLSGLRGMTAVTDATVSTYGAMRANERVTRSLAVTIGLGGVIYAAMDSPEIVHQARLLESWWTPAAVVLVVGFCLALAVAGIKAQLTTVRRIAATLAVNYLLSVAVFPLASEFGGLEGQASWIGRIIAIGAVAAALVWTPKITLAYLVVTSIIASFVARYGAGDSALFDYVQHAVRGFCTAGLFAWVVVFAVRATTLLDTESSRAAREAAAIAAVAARTKERAKFAALIHDGVLSTLLDASRGRESAILAEQAGRTLQEMNEFRSEAVDRSEYDAAAAIGFLRAAAVQVNTRVIFTARKQAGFDDLKLPVQAAETIAAALSEALRNSLRHAAEPGRDVRREIVATVGAGGLRVAVIDDGAGFDPAAVPTDRLGVSLSILGRMRELPGGAAFVESSPGRGTTVTLVWGSDGIR
ncbi:sensor histidine kinase [Antrihabitans sp. NCIMB 15449]|uniref:Sensor histidine kinase n=2 Tax=Antrihabitans spumae TaxID=3373370 RepID=A0ABW7JG14_9NOCA